MEAAEPKGHILSIEEAPQVETEAPQADNLEGQPQTGETPDLAPAEPEKVTFTPEQQEVFNQAIGRKTKAQRDAERESAALRQQLEEARSKIPQEQAPVVPPMPDPLESDNYDAEVRARDEAIAKRAAFEARKEVAEQTERQQREAAQARQVETVQAQARSYAEKAKDLGITPEVLQVAASTVQQANISDHLVLHILGDDQGPAITKHLADNPLVLDQVSTMSPLQAAAYIEAQVKPNLSGKKLSSAPPPPDEFDGGGVPPQRRGPPGATFE